MKLAVYLIGLLCFVVFRRSMCITLPDVWIKYLSWLQEWYIEHPNTCLPQVLYPTSCQMMMCVKNDPNGRYLLSHSCCLPPVLVWNPLQQYPLNIIRCPLCQESLLVKKWNVGQDKGSKPRTIQHIDSVVLLVGVQYGCPNLHKILSYDPRILYQIPDVSCVPFVLTHRSGFTKRVLNLLIANLEHGNGFQHVLSILENCRSSFVTHVQHHLNTLFNPPNLSRFTLTSVFIQHFFIDKEDFFNAHMRSGTSNGWLCIDHTFKVASNIGYVRSDGKWITQYRSVFIIMNDVGRVLSWQFTKSESTSEIRSLMQGVHRRSKKLNFPISYVMLDNCCHWHSFLQDVFGLHIKVKLDLFHAVQRITKTFSKKDPNYNRLICELRLVFRAAGDVGKSRTLPTPLPSVLFDNLEAFVSRWKDVANFNNTTLTEIENLKKHIMKGCLSEIPPGIGTNRNEALHKHINPYFCGKSRIGAQAAYALLCILFYLHNKKTEKSNMSDCTEQLQLDKQNIKVLNHDHSYEKTEQFGVLGKQVELHEYDFWGTSKLMSFEDINDTLLTLENPEVDHTLTISFEEARKIIWNTVNIVKMMENMSEHLMNSPFLQPSLFSLTTSLSRLSRCNTFSLQHHEDRLNEVIRISGLKRLTIEGDGNCCFTAISQALKILFENCIPNVKEEMDSLQLDLQAPIQSVSAHIRQIVVNEWMEFEMEYKEFLSEEEDFASEASKFLETGFFTSSLGDTVLKAASNGLGIPIIAVTSIDRVPVLKFEPRNFCVHAPILVAYNQFGAGHYDALTYVAGMPHQEVPVTNSTRQQVLSCKCGINVNKPSCCQNSNYRSRCPCLKSSTNCSEKCSCKQCQNPFGQKPDTLLQPPKTRVRQAHKLHSTHQSNTMFLTRKQEKISKGKWSEQETVLVIEVDKFLNKHQSMVTMQNIHELYHELLGVIQINNIKIAIGCKSLSSIVYKLQQLKKVKEKLLPL